MTADTAAAEDTAVTGAGDTVATNNDKNMFQRVKQRFSSRSNKKVKTESEKKEPDNMEEVTLSEKDTVNGEQKIADDKNEKKLTGIEKVKELLKGSKQTKESEETENKNEELQAKKKAGTLERVKDRLSMRKGNKISKQETTTKQNEENAKSPEQSETICNGQDNKTDEEKSEPIIQDGKKKVGTLERVKERLSLRKAKKSKEEITVNDTTEEKSSDAEDKSAENDPENDTEIAADQPETETKDEKVKTDTFLQRLLRLFRSKKKKSKSENETADNINAKTENEDEIKNGSEISDEDKEILAICGEDKEETDSPSVPIITTTKPPLPGDKKSLIFLFIYRCQKCQFI